MAHLPKLDSGVKILKVSVRDLDPRSQHRKYRRLGPRSHCTKATSTLQSGRVALTLALSTALANQWLILRLPKGGLQNRARMRHDQYVS